MLVGNSTVLAREPCTVPRRRCGSRDGTRSRPLLLVVLVLLAALRSDHHWPGAEALSLLGTRLFSRRVSGTDADRPHQFQRATAADDAEYSRSRRSRRSAAPLLTGPSTAHDRREFFRREGNFQLNYKEYDDDLDLLHAIERRRPFRRRIFPWRKRRASSKAVLPLELDVVVEAPARSRAKRKGTSKSSRRRRKAKRVVVSNIQELHAAILDRGLELRDVDLRYAPPPSSRASPQSRPAANATRLGEVPSAMPADAPTPDGAAPFSHEVLALLARRYRARSRPSERASDDTAVLALAIEGGGMRGAVSGGMAAAVVGLGLADAFDAIYGSSAGSVIGSYFVSRQLYLDVYTDVIPAGKDLFVNKPKIVGDIVRNLLREAQRRPPGRGRGAEGRAKSSARRRSPATTGAHGTPSCAEALPPARAGGLNISFVLDAIMCPERGVRPLDLAAFAHNDARQPLRIVSSAVELGTGELKSVCFGAREGHFRDGFAGPGDAKDVPTDAAYLYPEEESARADEDGHRRGMWACLGASMTVPGAAGSPFRMNLPSDTSDASTPHLCYDAFCYEPVPFRSAVAEGATHVVALRSRPAGYAPKTQPTFYERTAAPLYFKAHGVPDTVTEFVARGGQQYLYAEDILTCDHGLTATGPVPIPPARVLYAGSRPATAADRDRAGWARAHLLPVAVPAGAPELGVLSQDRDAILAGTRAGFAAAYDALAPAVGLRAGPDAPDGAAVAALVFPEGRAPHASVLDEQRLLAGERLGRGWTAATEREIRAASAQATDAVPSAAVSSAPQRNTKSRRLRSPRRTFGFKRRGRKRAKLEEATPPLPKKSAACPSALVAAEAFSLLPGLRLGNLPMLAWRWQTYLQK